MKSTQGFDQNHELTPLENCKIFLIFLNRCFHSLQRLFFYAEGQKTPLFGLLCLKPKNKEIKKKTFFPIQILNKTDHVWPDVPRKIHRRKYSIFCQKPWTTTFEKFPFFQSFLKVYFSGLNSILFYPEYQKNIFSGLIRPKNTPQKRFDF